ncbi:MAG: sugar phosphate isomerase/epimerase [Deltaproteobacteria bacterium]|nr:sugar phosphate isomerase/epimerase [Deltaproteobacteria bacterium]
MYEIGSQINEVRTDGNLDILKQDLDYFQDIGLCAVEIPPHGLDVIKNGRLDKKRLKAVKEILSDHDFLYTVHAPNPLNLMDRDRPEIHLKVFHASLVFAQEIGANIVVYHAGRYIPEEAFYANFECNRLIRTKEELLDFEAGLLAQLADEYPQVTICIENARPYRHHSPYCYGEDLKELTTQVVRIHRPNVRITLDCGHLFMAARYFCYDLIIAVKEAAPWISHCHVHDNFGDACFYNEKQQTHQISFGKGDSHMPVGWGDIPFKDILAAMRQHYKGCFIMELRTRYFKDTGESKKNIATLVEPFKFI